MENYCFGTIAKKVGIISLFMNSDRLLNTEESVVVIIFGLMMGFASLYGLMVNELEVFFRVQGNLFVGVGVYLLIHLAYKFYYAAYAVILITKGDLDAALEIQRKYL